MKAPLNDKDIAIIDAVQRNGDWSHAEIGRHVGLSVSAVHERVRRLVANGVIVGWSALASPAALDLNLLAFVYVLIDRTEHIRAFLDGVEKQGEVMECHHLAGDWNYLLKVRVQTTAHLEHFISKVLKGYAGVTRTATTIVLAPVKETHLLNTSHLLSKQRDLADRRRL
ncbi:Lrp/AsnC family transcriptional regulator [Dongia sp.]|uniref:Lrp/AsnC family transcriptional regulator n=1 Tax=Dongia sp. TaxID=1977262 RepID=UPI0035AF5033